MRSHLLRPRIELSRDLTHQPVERDFHHLAANFMFHIRALSLRILAPRRLHRAFAGDLERLTVSYCLRRNDRPRLNPHKPPGDLKVIRQIATGPVHGPCTHPDSATPPALHHPPPAYLPPTPALPPP